MTPEQVVSTLTRRYDAEPEALIAVLCPILLPIQTLDKSVFVAPGESHARATFTVAITNETKGVLVRGRTGKFVPASYGRGAPGWREIAKGRIVSVDLANGVAEGEVYLGFGGQSLEELSTAIEPLTEGDFLEIDQFGASPKVLSGLAEYYLVQHLMDRGFQVVRMPEDMASHLGAYANFDFTLSRDERKKRLEVKSLWGTNTKHARLIHSTTTKPGGDPQNWTEDQRANYYPTSSCKFATQDFFAVSLFLRTGNIRDFAFSRSIARSAATPHGLPAARRHPEHVNQNPLCEIGDGTWFSDINEVWDLP